MRDFFINGLEVIIGIIVVVSALGIVAAAATVAFVTTGGMNFNGTVVQGGPLAGFGILILGGIYLIFIGGFMYLGLGIYQNTRRTADAMEKLAASGR